METYYFDFEDGSRCTRDAEGHQLPDPEAARVEALQALAEVLLHEPSDLDSRAVSCTVRKGDGTLVYSASLSIEGRRGEGCALSALPPTPSHGRAAI